jgi:DNA polymerase I - 3''-5'' exonuclease and polymerase domains
VATLLGRIRYLPEINSTNAQIRGFAERTALNTPIQGTSADIIKKAMIDVFESLGETGLRSRMLIQVHDELLFEVPESEKDRVIPLIKQKMEEAVKLDVPVIADLKTGADWNDMEKLKAAV